MQAKVNCFSSIRTTMTKHKSPINTGTHWYYQLFLCCMLHNSCFRVMINYCAQLKSGEHKDKVSHSDSKVSLLNNKANRSHQMTTSLCLSLAQNHPKPLHISPQHGSTQHASVPQPHAKIKSQGIGRLSTLDIACSVSLG